MKRLNSDPEDSIDIIFAGDSECGYAFAPLVYWREYGWSSENIGYPNERLCDTNAMMQQIVKRNSVDLLVLETDSFFADARVFANEDVVLEKAEQVFEILHYHKVYRRLKPESGSFMEGDKNANKGYWLRRGVKPYTGPENYVELKKSKNDSISEEALKYIKQIVQLCEQNNIEILFVTTPGPSYWTSERYEALTQLSDELGVTYLDMNFKNEEIGLDWKEDTMDGGAHLNHNGCMKLNAWFAEYLKSKYEFDDHRGDPKYDSWKTALENLGGVY